METRKSVTPQLYARDVVITAVLCFTGEDRRRKDSWRQRGRRDLDELRCSRSPRAQRLKVNICPHLSRADV